MFLSFILAAALAQAAAGAQVPPPVATPQAAEQAWPPPGVFAAKAPGVTSPRLKKTAEPRYTRSAMEAKIQGTVTLQAVIERDGSVGGVRVTQSLDPILGLDDEAVKTVKKWKFTPGMKDGVPVPVAVDIEMTFTLK